MLCTHAAAGRKSSTSPDSRRPWHRNLRGCPCCKRPTPSITPRVDSNERNDSGRRCVQGGHRTVPRGRHPHSLDPFLYQRLARGFVTRFRLVRVIPHNPSLVLSNRTRFVCIHVIIMSWKKWGGVLFYFYEKISEKILISNQSRSRCQTRCWRHCPQPMYLRSGCSFGC